MSNGPFIAKDQINYTSKYFHTYHCASVTVTEHVWEMLMADIDELHRLRERVAEYEQRDREYLQWSANGGMLEAVMTGFKMGAEEAKNA